MREKLEDVVANKHIVGGADGFADQIKQVKSEKLMFGNAMVDAMGNGGENSIGLIGIFLGDGGEIDNDGTRVERELFERRCVVLDKRRKDHGWKEV